MKFEKLNDNKIKITLSIQDLTDKHIDFHSFMANTLESQDILLDMLEEAKKETGFDPEDSNLKIEALAMADSDFIFTITKVHSDTEKSPKKKFTIKRRSVTPCNATQAIYEFHSFEDFCSLLQFLNKSNLISFVNDIATCVSLYQYKGCYYLLMTQINSDLANKLKFFTAITEFAKYITNSKVFASKLRECGNLVMKDHAFEIASKHFICK